MWHEIPLDEAYGVELPHPGIQGPYNSEGEECSWPWEPMLKAAAAIGMFHCGYCGEMCVASVPHPDYKDVDYSEVTEP
jgi:hypothetical protein